MSLSLAALAVTFLAPVPQEADEPTILSSSEVKSLNGKVRDWFSAWVKWEYESDSPKARTSAKRKMDKAKRNFQKDWDSKLRKGDLLASVPDLVAVFANAFEYEKVSGSGNLKVKKPGPGAPGYGVVVPRGYAPAKAAYRGMVVLPGYDSAKSAWAEPQEYLDRTWRDASLNADSVYVVPMLNTLGDPIALDPVPDFSREGEEKRELDRLGAVFGVLGEANREYNLDRERLILDCGKEASAFGLRVASYFPTRFAGIVLRDPVDITAAIRTGSLTGLPILLVSSADTKEACAGIAKVLNGLEAGACTILEGKGDYPFTESRDEIAKWVEGARRNLFRGKVVLEPNSDRFKSGYWVVIGTAEPLADLAPDDKPQLIVEADRAANRITVSARSISDFTLLLNDQIIDLSKPFTVVVNGTAMKEERQRSFLQMTERLQQRFDPGYIFTADFATSVPKADGKAGGDGEEK